MKKSLLSAVALTIVSSSAFAADLPTRKAPLPVMTTVSPWQGVYAGINAGYGLNNITGYGQGFSYTPGPYGSPGYANANTGNEVEYVAGGVAGGQLGYNHVFANHWMLGAEIDLDWADIYNNANPNQSNNINAYSNGYGGASANIQNNYGRLGLDWIGTVRARIGYDMGRFLPYITGGFAYGGLSNTINLSCVGCGGPILAAAEFAPIGQLVNASFTNGSSSSVSVGWAAGAGAEYMVTDNWSLKGEYLYTSIGGISTPVYTINASNYQGVNSVGYGTANTGTFGVHQVRAGLNYHTNWLSDAPVVAKY